VGDSPGERVSLSLWRFIFGEERDEAFARIVAAAALDDPMQVGKVP
jgi:hypothetical protein